MWQRLRNDVWREGVRGGGILRRLFVFGMAGCCGVMTRLNYGPSFRGVFSFLSFLGCPAVSISTKEGRLVSSRRVT